MLRWGNATGTVWKKRSCVKPRKPLCNRSSHRHPMNHNQEQDGYSLGTRDKVFLAGWSLFLLSGFTVAAMLEPNPRGYGTHQGLGLPPCTFRVLLEIPCPSCGMTTSFSNFVRGRMMASGRANIAGLLMAIVCAVQIPWCWLSIVQGRLWRVSQPLKTLLWLLLILCGVSLLQWIVRLIEQ